jgi:predicted dienelactone hydrolase
MRFTTRQVLAGLTVSALTFAVVVQLPAVVAEASAGMAADLRVGHTVKRIVVPGSAAGEPRRVDVHLWYPADQRGLSDATKTVYRSALWGRELIPARWDPLRWEVEAEIARESDPADRRAVIDPTGRPLPVIVFSHGATNDPIDYAFTLELIAGAGFVVAAPYHVNNTQDDVRIDFANSQAGVRLFTCNDGRPSPCARTNVPFSMADRVRDIGHILDELPRWFGDRVDVSRAGVLGHSRGTVTALAAAGGSASRSPTLNCQPAPADLCWPLAGEPRVKAIMGMAIGARPITFGANLENVRVPALLVAGRLDQTSVPAVSEDAFDALSSEEKALVSIEKATHRSFDSTYCAQLQAAGAVAAKNGGRALLDLHTVTGIASSPPMGLSGKAVHYCSHSFFTRPVSIEPLVASIPGSEFPPRVGPPSVCTSTSIPCTGLDTEEVKQGIKELAVTFFGTVLKRPGKDGPHFTRYLAPKWLEKHEPMVGSGNPVVPGAEAFAGADAICPPGQGVVCED